MFYCFGEADSKYKGNDFAAHEANERKVIEVLKRDYGITHVNARSDACKGQYCCLKNIANIAHKHSTADIIMSLTNTEPACGKCQCDSASRVATRIKDNAIKDGKWVPNGTALFKECYGATPSKAAFYAEYESQRNGYKLGIEKGE